MEALLAQFELSGTERRALLRGIEDDLAALEDHPIIARVTDLYKVPEAKQLFRASKLLWTLVLEIKVISGLARALGRESRVADIARLIVEAFVSDMSPGDRVLKVRYLLEVYSLGPEVLPHELQQFLEEPQLLDDRWRLA